MLLNTARALAFMEHYRLDALVAATPVSIRYLSDYACWLDPVFKAWMMRPGASSDLPDNYAVFTRDGRIGLVIGALFGVNAADLPIDDLRLVGDPGLDATLTPAELPLGAHHWQHRLAATAPSVSAVEAVTHLFHDYGLAGACIGIEQDGVPARQVAELRHALPQAELRDASNLLRLIRAVKSAAELERLTRAAEISEDALQACLELARPGRAMADLAQHYRAAVAAAGATYDHFAYSPYGTGIATEPDYVLPADDILYVDVGCIYRGYYSDTGLTLACSALSFHLRDRYVALQSALEAAVALARPGTRVSRLQAAMASTLAAAGITHCFPHGHGVGLEVRDYPIVVPDTGLPLRDECVDQPSDLALEVDMVINLEAPLFMPGVGSLHIEQSFVVTVTGCRPLVSQDRAQPVLAAAAQ